MISTEASMSSIVTAAHGLPCFDILRCSDVMSPAMTTVEPSGRCSSCNSVAIDTSAAAASTCSSPDSGWSDTYRPSISRSNASRCFLSQSGRSGTTTAKPCAPSSPPIEVGEQVELPLGLLALHADHRVDRLLVHQQQRAARVTERVERPGLDERLDGPLVADDGRHLVEEVGEGRERALLLARPHDRVDHVGADVADGGQTEPDVLADGREVGRRRVDVRRRAP